MLRITTEHVICYHHLGRGRRQTTRLQFPHRSPLVSRRSADSQILGEDQTAIPLCKMRCVSSWLAFTDRAGSMCTVSRDTRCPTRGSHDPRGVACENRVGCNTEHTGRQQAHPLPDAHFLTCRQAAITGSRVFAQANR